MFIKNNTRTHYTVLMVYQQYLKYNSTFRQYTDIKWVVRKHMF